MLFAKVERVVHIPSRLRSASRRIVCLLCGFRVVGPYDRRKEAFTILVQLRLPDATDLEKSTRGARLSRGQLGQRAVREDDVSRNLLLARDRAAKCLE